MQEPVRKKDGTFSTKDMTYYQPVLDLPAVHSILQVHGVPKDDWEELTKLWELCFWASNREWSSNDVTDLIEDLDALKG